MTDKISALLTTTMPGQAKTIEALKAAAKTLLS